jgi:hypothetical protein
MNLRRLLRATNWRLALGEFALIFVGIIAALAADDWNTRRLEREDEIEALEGIRAALASDLEELQTLSDLFWEKRDLARALHAHLKAGLPYHDSLAASFGAVYGFKESFLNRAAYEALRSKGFDLVSDDSLRVQIIRLYDEEYREVELVDERHRSTVMELYRPYFLERFVDIDFNNSATPLDYPALLRDQYFINLIEYRAAQLQFDTGPVYETAAARSSALLTSLERALDGMRE